MRNGCMIGECRTRQTMLCNVPHMGVIHKINYVKKLSTGFPLG